MGGIFFKRIVTCFGGFALTHQAFKSTQPCSFEPTVKLFAYLQKRHATLMLRSSMARVNTTASAISSRRQGVTLNSIRFHQQLSSANSAEFKTTSLNGFQQLSSYRCCNARERAIGPFEWQRTNPGLHNNNYYYYYRLLDKTGACTKCCYDLV